MNKSNTDYIEVEGIITELFPNTLFKVKLDMGGEVLGHLCGKMRKRYIKLTVGDRVRTEISKYDPSVCRITYRLSGTSIVKKNTKRFFKKK